MTMNHAPGPFQPQAPMHCVIAVGPKSALEQFAAGYARQLEAVGTISGAEGYRVCIKRGQGSPAVFVIGNEARGVLFGVGRLLRELQMRRGSVTLAEELDMAS